MIDNIYNLAYDLLKWWLRDKTTNVLLWAIDKLNPSKDNSLSYRLHLMADHYDTKPSGLWD